MRHPNLQIGMVFEIDKGTHAELEHSLTLGRTQDTNAANIVAISRYQYVRLLPARVVSGISTSYVNHLLIPYLPRFDVWLFKFSCTLLLRSSSKFQWFFM